MDEASSASYLENRWFYVRLVPLVLVLLWFARATNLDITATIPILRALLFIATLAVVVFFWITLGPDDGGRYSLKELFLSAPLLPISRNTCAVWTYLGVVVLAATVSLLWSTHTPSRALLIDVAFGLAILSATT